MFAPNYVAINQLVPFLQMQIKSDQKYVPTQMRKAAITCLYQLTQKNPEAVLGAVINNQLEEQLLDILDSEMDELVSEGIRDILTALLRHVAPKKPSRWIDLCRSVFSKVSPHAVSDAHLNHDDDEPEPDQKPPTKLERRSSKVLAPETVFNIAISPRWRTQIFVVKNVREVLRILNSQQEKAHFDLSAARKGKRANADSDWLIFRLADLIGIAFNASTSQIKDLNLEGLLLLQEVIKVFLPFYLNGI